MAIALVQTTKGTASSIDQKALAYASNNTAGNLLVGCFYCHDVIDGLNDRTISSVTDTQGNTWTLAFGPIRQSSLGPLTAYLYYVKNCAGGANTVTVVWNVGDQLTLGVAIYEASGVDTTAPLEASNSATGASSAIDSGSVTTAADAFLVGFETNSSNVTTAGTGWTQDNVLDCSWFCRTESRIVSGAGTYNATWATPATASQWFCGIGAFKGAAASFDPTAIVGTYPRALQPTRRPRGEPWMLSEARNPLEVPADIAWSPVYPGVFREDASMTPSGQS